MCCGWAAGNRPSDTAPRAKEALYFLPLAPSPAITTNNKNNNGGGGGGFNGVGAHSRSGTGAHARGSGAAGSGGTAAAAESDTLQRMRLLLQELLLTRDVDMWCCDVKALMCEALALGLKLPPFEESSLLDPLVREAKF